jgi:hypothetical protein
MLGPGVARKSMPTMHSASSSEVRYGLSALTTWAAGEKFRCSFGDLLVTARSHPESWLQASRFYEKTEPL